jgi:hypothetical protein
VVDEIRPFDPVNVIRDQAKLLYQEKIEVMPYERCIGSQESYRNRRVEGKGADWETICEGVEPVALLSGCSKYIVQKSWFSKHTGIGYM